MFVFLGWYLVASCVAFALYGLDKRRATQRMRRIPERQLLALSLIGGGVGGLLAMQLFRHKTQRPVFWAIQWLAILFHGGLMIWLLW